MFKPSPTLLSTFALGCSTLLVGSSTLRSAPEPLSSLSPVASPHSVVTQRVGITAVGLDYSRPGKKGREVFGQLVPLGEVWRTGANACTKLTFSGSATFGGKPVPAGRYGLFSIPGADHWTIILSKNADQWGNSAYQPADDLLRLTVKAETLAASVETETNPSDRLGSTISLSDVQEDSAQLCIEWDRTQVSVPITVDTIGEMKAEIARIDTANEATPKFYMQAAGYYLSHHLGENQTLVWIDSAIEGMGLPGKTTPPPAAGGQPAQPLGK